MNFSQRAANIKPSATLALANKAKEMKAQGIDVINLSVGEPDFKTPAHIKQAAIEAIQAGKADAYTAATGILPLREAIATYTNNDYQTNFTAKNVAVTVGGKLSLYALAQVLFEAGDEVLIPLPYWVSYGEQVKLAEAKPIFVAPALGNDKVSVVELEAKRTDKTKACIINSPQNPAGLIYSREELEAIGNWAVEHEIILIADDMYSKLVYNGNQFVSLLNLSDAIRKQTILVNGLSKAYAMTGWRVGYTVASEEVIQKLAAFLGHATSNLAAVSQYAALAALTGDQACVEEMRQAYEERLNTIYPQLVALPGFKFTKPQGAFYMFPNIRETLELTGFKSADDFAAALLEQAHVAVVVGSAFGMPDCIRISYATDLASLQEAVKRMKKFIEEYRH
ncbi:pyridoxal phosphate-dependent aminotransferase [Ligilactobacillus agilis]|uniref:pyridoxal phosphate-dependent aminotransferase n=1 Tax=Ligilactobacillus agilis TaxID=1601 RepID=UPI00067F49E0|nr:pyridoxal phosphate-dependent aminotransferase [Ligilactobacillus agilis]UNL43115.1 pyridoxal phosphate-dependent aminotransferase [Ligilactobacillus agilis]UNL57888.1 pyridoxal phosphate-dependent aminotransferase [Ligilactobacillus agilis]